MKRYVKNIAFSALCLLAVACGGGNEPESVAKKFLEATTSGEIAEAKKYTDEQTGMMLGMTESMITPEKKAEMAKQKPDIEILSSEVKDSTAVVKYKITNTKTKESVEKQLDMKQVKGDWKVTVKKEGKN